MITTKSPRKRGGTRGRGPTDRAEQAPATSAATAAFEHLQHIFGGRKTLAALPMATLARLVFVAPPALDGLQRRRHDPSHPHFTPTVVSAWSHPGLRSLA